MYQPGLGAVPEKEQFKIIDADISLYREVDLGDSYDVLLRELIDNIRWKQESIKIYGKKHPQPRLSAWYGDENAAYSYSGIKLQPMAWTPLLSAIKSRVETISGYSFNSVLLNYYRDQNDCMGMHSDDESDLGTQPVIASLSLGEERDFILKHKYRKDIKTIKLPLSCGSLLLMKGDTQARWKHGINRLRQPCGARVNLTFRQISQALSTVNLYS
jgi:alkylated DNA repair dioxygenase AlkB